MYFQIKYTSVCEVCGFASCCAAALNWLIKKFREDLNVSFTGSRYFLSTDFKANIPATSNKKATEKTTFYLYIKKYFGHFIRLSDSTVGPQTQAYHCSHQKKKVA